HNFKNSLKSSGSSLAIVDSPHEFHGPKTCLWRLPEPVGSIFLVHISQRGHRDGSAVDSGFGQSLLHASVAFHFIIGTVSCQVIILHRIAWQKRISPA